MESSHIHLLAEGLRRERGATEDRLAGLSVDFDAMIAASRDSNADDEHDPEGSTIGFERSQLDALRQQARARIIEIDEAIARLAAGTYGVCETCGGSIPEARLEVKPTARTCVTCAASAR